MLSDNRAEKTELVLYYASMLMISQDTMLTRFSNPSMITMIANGGINTSRGTFPKGSVGYIQPVGNRIGTFQTYPDTSWNLPDASDTCRVPIHRSFPTRPDTPSGPDT